MNENMPFRAFWDALDARLAGCSYEELKSGIRSLATTTDIYGRQNFLDRLASSTPHLDPLSLIEKGELLSDIRDFRERVSEEREEEEGGYLDNLGGHDTEEEDFLIDPGAEDPYGDFAPEMADLLDRAEAVFDFGDLPLARSCYRSLFKVLVPEDELGSGLTWGHFFGVDVKGNVTRYLLALYLTEDASKRPAMLFKVMSNPALRTPRYRPSICDVLSLAGGDLPDWAEFMASWMAFLRLRVSRDADAWLREAVTLHEGVDGLARLAKTEGNTRPRAYVDWMRALNDGKDYARTISVASEAFAAVPQRKGIRSRIADLLHEAGRQQGDQDAVRLARWEALIAAPALVRLLDLWESIDDPPQRKAVMQRAYEEIERARISLQDRSFFSDLDEDYEEEDCCEVRWIDVSLAVHACLLGELWDEALSWVGGKKRQGLSDQTARVDRVLPCLLVLITQGRTGELPGNLSDLWQLTWKEEGSRIVTEDPGPERVLDESETEDLFGRYEETLQRTRRTYEDLIREAEALKPAMKERILHQCVEEIMEAVKSTLAVGDRVSYPRAARLIAACVEVLKILGKEEEATATVSQVSEASRRNKAFWGEFKRAMSGK